MPRRYLGSRVTCCFPSVARSPSSILRSCLALFSLLFVSVFFAGLAVPRDAQAQDKSALTPSRLHLPKGPGSLEGIGENVEPNLNMGLASYGVAIDLPEGYAGATPALRLVYSSGAGNSDVGLGWSLSVPSIERMTSRGLPRYSQSDLIAANGSDELVRVASTGTYRARFEGGFVRYTWVDSAADGRGGYWTAEYPDGRVGYFGATSDGTSVPTALVQGSQGVFRWHLTEVVDTLGHHLRYDYVKDGAVSHLSRISYVFDTQGKAKQEVILSYELRPDNLSDAKAGFELQITQRLVGIQALTSGVQLRRYKLSYETADKSGGLSRLATVHRYGLNDAGPFPVAFSFAYSAGLGTSVPEVVPVGGPLGIDFRTGAADLNDLNGDSLPDVVDTSGTQHRIFLASLDANNHPRFGTANPSATGTSPLTSKSVEMFDLDGDGHADMVDTLNALVLWNKGNGDWSVDNQPTALSFPDLAADANLRPIDYDNDRLIDLIHSDASTTWIYANRGNGRFELVQDGIDAIGAGFVSDGLQLADLNGDGMQDVVRRGSGLVAYRMNLGLGHFSDWINVTGAPTTTNEEHWVDLNGDGLADWVSVVGNAVVYAINRNGRELSTAVTLNASSTLAIPEKTSDIRVRFADMNGSGSTDVVWIDMSGKVTYLELFPTRPNLLTMVDNGIGKTIALTYGTSTAHMRRDGGPSAWHYRLPHPIATLDSIIVRDALTGTEQLHSFQYSDGFYDGVERQFRGFEQVSASAPGDSSIDASTNLYQYDVGATDLYHKGLLVTQVSKSSAAVIAKTDNGFADCKLTAVPTTTPAIRFVCPTATTKTLQEGRPESEWVTIQEKYQFDGYGNRVLTSKLGVTDVGKGGCGACLDPTIFGAPCDATCRGDESYQATDYVSPDATGGRWILNKPWRSRAFGVEGSTSVSEKTYYYDGQPFVGLAAGQLTIGQLSRIEARVSANPSDVVELERYKYNGDGAVVESWDPNGNRRTFEYDATSLALVAENIHFDTAESPYALRMEAQYDPVLDLVVQSTSWMRVVGGSNGSPPRSTAYAYDAFGRLSAIAHPGDTLDAPTEQYTYELAAPTSRIVKRARSTKGAATDIEEIQCFDGLGRSLQKRTLIEPGSYQVSGAKQYNVAGGVWKDYQAYTRPAADCEATPADVLFTENFYDGAGRVRRARKADKGIYGSSSVVDTEYFPLRTVVRDELDTQPASDTNPAGDTPTTTEVDGLGRTVAIERKLKADKAIRSNVFYDELGGLAGTIDAAGNRKTQVRDLLGRVVSVVDPDSGTSTFTYDAASNVVSRTDARKVTVRSSYDPAGRKLAEWQEGNEAATRITYQYDFLEGCSKCSNLEGVLARVTFPLSDDRSQKGEDNFGYDERTQPTYLARNIGGSKFEFATSYDNAGHITGNTYPAGLSLDFKRDNAGRLKSVGSYVSGITYDNRGLLSTQVFGNGVTTTYEYDAIDRLSSINGKHSSGTQIQQVKYERDRVGNILNVTDGTAEVGTPSANATYKYDALYRLVRADLDPAGSHAETLTFAYDDVDNILNKSSNKGTASRDHVGEYAYGQDGAGPHAVTTAGRLAFKYDASGNLTQRDADGFEWDFLGRMASAATNSAPVARFWYGAATDRVKKTEQGQTTYYLTPDFEIRDVVATLYVRIGGQRVAKVETLAPSLLPDLAPAHLDGTTAVPDPDGKTTAGDAWIAQASSADVFKLDPKQTSTVVDELLGAAVSRLLGLPQDDAVKVTYFHNDNLGTAVAVTDANGKVVERRVHYPHGLDRRETPPQEVAYAFSGKEKDQSTGLTFFGARYYIAQLGRWAAVDPLFAILNGGADALSREALDPFAYVGNNPIGYRDSSGLSWSDAVHGAWDHKGDIALGFVKGFAMGVATVAVVAVAAAVTPVLGTVAAVGFGVYGAVQTVRHFGELKAAAVGVITGKGSSGDYETIGAIAGGIASSSVAKPVYSAANSRAASVVARVRQQMTSQVPAAEGAIGYHATYPEAAQSILKEGFRPGTKPGRLGSGGVYVNDSPAGAIAEFSHHNPGVTPTVLKVKYNPGTNASTSVPPQNYVSSHPLSVDSISAPSIRAPGTVNTNVLNGSASPIGVVE